MADPQKPVSEFARAVIGAAQTDNKKEKQKLERRAGALLKAGYKPSDDDLYALKYYFLYERRGRRPLVNNPVEKIVRDVRALHDREDMPLAMAFEFVKMFRDELQHLSPAKLHDLEDKVTSELRRSRKSKATRSRK